MILYAIYGVSGFGREVIPVARSMLKKEVSTPYEVVFVDDNPVANVVNGHRVLTYEQFISEGVEQMHVNVAIANSLAREQMVNRCAKDGVSLFSLIAENAVVLDKNEIGEGAIICPFSMITSNARIGRAFHANIYSYVAHDCVIGDYVTFAPGVKCNGNVVIEDHAYTGTGAILRLW